MGSGAPECLTRSASRLVGSRNFTVDRCRLFGLGGAADASGFDGGGGWSGRTAHSCLSASDRSPARHPFNHAATAARTGRSLLLHLPSALEAGCANQLLG